MKKIITVCRIGFIDPDGRWNETEFDTDNETEAMKLFGDFCKENHFDDVRVEYIEYGQEEIEEE